jgi:NAD(P)-dependent dehydrogenase (short-subunit alcohol dehydrogenase family)
MNTFTGKVVLIAGAGLGVGRALAEAFAAQGAMVAANDLTPINLDETVARIRAAGGLAQPFVADIASKLALQTMLYEIADAYGRIDILLNCASAAPADALLEIDEWDWRRALDINLTGPFLLMQSVARMMLPQGGGTIIHFTEIERESAAALSGQSGLVGLTRAAAREFAPDNIRVHLVCSGDPKLGISEPELIPGLPENPVELGLYLCGENAGHLNGMVIGFRG